MKLVVGLGNPGAKYTDTRHNAGFWAVDEIHRLYAFPTWQKKFKGEASKHNIQGMDVVLLKPQTFMNLSGESVQAAAAYFKIKPEDIIVFHDELDLLPGKIKVKQGGGAAGHNGLKSMDRMLGTPSYWRVRLGIGHPGRPEMVSPYVLGNTPKEERLLIEDRLQSLLPRMAHLLKNDISTFLNDGSPNNGHKA